MTRDANNDAQRALYALSAGAEGCGTAARNARLVHDDEFADFLCGVQDDIVGEASKTKARAQEELRVAVLVVRDEAMAVAREEREAPEEKIAETSSEAQG